ncbi:MAG: transketolase [candidate division TM6 bacterium GW2011_GWF2_37_49]|nr:MAG: transketolase [candidate division TM6 bacterium GW2011_GWF2_37_49]
MKTLNLAEKNRALCKKAQEVRLSILDMVTNAKSSHIGSAFSIVEILTIIYNEFMSTNLIKNKAKNRDYFILSKGHAASAFYATLASVGIVSSDLLSTFYQDGSVLAGHPTKDCVAGVEASTGSLGHGLSMAVGIAFACKQDGLSSKAYVLLGDGECQEGSVWEAVMLAVRLKLNNLIIIIDSNKLQGFDRTEDLLPSSLKNMFEGFGCNCLSVDGHDFIELRTAIGFCGQTHGPDVIIANTIKGNGVSFMQDKLEWHYKSLSPEQYILAKNEILKHKI